MRVLVNDEYQGDDIESDVDLYALALWYCVYGDEKVVLTVENEYETVA